MMSVIADIPNIVTVKEKQKISPPMKCKSFFKMRIFNIACVNILVCFRKNSYKQKQNYIILTFFFFKGSI